MIVHPLLHCPWCTKRKTILILFCSTQLFSFVQILRQIFASFSFIAYACFKITLLNHCGESHDIKILKNGRFLSKPLDSGKSFIDISVNTGQICMGFETGTSENCSNMPIFSDIQTKIWLKSY